MSLKLFQDPTNVFFRCVEDANESIMITDASGRLLYVNPAWTKIYGYSTEEAIGQTPKILHSQYQTKEFYQKMWEQILDPQIGCWKGELTNKTKDGNLIPVNLTITPYRDHQGTIQGYMGIAIDISNKKILESQVAHQDRLASIGLLASGLAHEVGTPLGVIRGRAEFLMMKAEQPLVKQNLEIITSQIDRISKLIRSLLRVSRSFSDVHLERLSLLEVVQEVLVLMKQSFDQQNTEIKIDIPEQIYVKADSGRLQQVLINLLMNAVHAIGVAKKQGRGDGHFIFLQGKVLDQMVKLTVKDSGCGMTPEQLKLIFKPFFTTKDVGEGTGLGLAITAQLIHEMEGKIRVESIEGKETSFLIYLNHLV